MARFGEIISLSRNMDFASRAVNSEVKSAGSEALHLINKEILFGQR
jgi:hypothetical protein